MTLFSVAKKNIKGNFKNYLIYFISMIFSVVIYYTFVALQYSPEIHKSIQSWDVMRSIFVQASIMLILFVAVFIWYSNSFFTKKRKKQVGLYSLLGLPKKTIGKMLFYENLIMGTIAVAIGILLGTLLSKLFTMMLLKLLGSTIYVSLTFSASAIINTLIVFAIIIFFTSFQAYRLIYRFKLIHLFQAEKEGEHAPKASIAVAVMSIIVLAFSYWIVFQPIMNNRPIVRLGIFLVGLIIGTYLLFRSFIVYLLMASQKNKSRYYKGLNLIGTSHLLYRITGNARTLTIIALLSAATLSAISVGFSEYYSVEKSAMNFSPFSYTHISKGEAFDNRVKEIIMKDSKHPIIKQLDVPVIQVNGDISDLPHVPFGYKAGNIPIRLLSTSTYNQLVSALNWKGTLQLTGNQALAIRPISDQSTSNYVGLEVILKVPEGNQKVTFVKMINDRIFSYQSPDEMMVVSDKLYDAISKQLKPFTYKAYKVKNQQSAKATSKRLTKLNSEGVKMSTYYNVYKKQLESAGMDIFLLGFLGLVFLAATGSIIYFKQLTEAHSDKKRYEILRKIGVKKSEIFFTIAKQTFFVFIWPLIVGIFHCAMILKAIFGVSLTKENMVIPIVASIGAYVIIYLGYYILTVHSYKKIVVQ